MAESRQSQLLTRVKTRLRRGDVVSTQGSIVQILKFENGRIIARHLGSADVTYVNPHNVQVNLSVIGDLEKRYRIRQREHHSWVEGRAVEILSTTTSDWCCGKILRRFLLAENPEVVHDLWFSLVFYDMSLTKLRYKQLKYDDHRIRDVENEYPRESWELLGVAPPVLASDEAEAPEA